MFVVVNDDGHVIKIFFSKSYMHVYGHPISYSLKVRYNSDENRAGGGIGGAWKMCFKCGFHIYVIYCWVDFEVEFSSTETEREFYIVLFRDNCIW